MLPTDLSRRTRPADRQQMHADPWLRGFLPFSQPAAAEKCGRKADARFDCTVPDRPRHFQLSRTALSSPPCADSVLPPLERAACRFPPLPGSGSTWPRTVPRSHSPAASPFPGIPWPSLQLPWPSQLHLPPKKRERFFLSSPAVVHFSSSGRALSRGIPRGESRRTPWRWHGVRHR